MSISSTPNSEYLEVISQTPPYHLRIAYFISIWCFKAAITVSLASRRLFTQRPPNLLQPEVKSYPIRSFLKNRIFRPDGSGQEPLPLYLDVHGGGWAVADPETDDEFCSFTARNFNILVISIDYRKAPSWKFPYAVSDVAAIVDAILQDESLNIDCAKVVPCGLSAGGNLAFAASQVERLKGRISGLVGFFPCLHLTESVAEKLQRRPPEAGSDILESSANFLAWAYLPYGVNRRDAQVSPRWAGRQDLPPHVYLVGAEYDLLCYEASQLAESLADPEDERMNLSALSSGDGWMQGGVS